MKKWKRALRRFVSDETAVTSIEYALATSLIAIVCIAAVLAIGGSVSLLFTEVCNEVSTAVLGAPTC